MKPPLAIPVGDPAGVGPEVACTAASALLLAGEVDRAALFGDGARLQRLAEGRGIPARRVDAAELDGLGPGELGIVDVGAIADATVDAHAPTPEGGRAQLAALDAAIAAVQRGSARAVVTGPTSKEAVTMGGTSFVGQTEHLAASAGLAPDDVTMMFLGPRLRVALVTTHLAIVDVPQAITAPRVRRATKHLSEALLRLAGPEEAVRIEIAGLNPHAGEGGLFGQEEARVVGPTVDALRAEAHDPRLSLIGPSPAEAVFRRARDGKIDGVVAMFHDQATIASKLLDWGEAVNTTWGLPFVRTSVDHGVAYDAARDGVADDDGMRAAIRLAGQLTT